MPVTLSNIASKSKRVVLWFGEEGNVEESLNIDYRPNIITEETLLRLQEFRKMTDDTISESFVSYNKTLASLIKSWDMLEDDGETIIPVTPENMASLGIIVRGMILDAIMEDISPKAAAPKTQN